MRKRNVLENAVEDILEASTCEEVESTVAKAVDEATPLQNNAPALREATINYHRGQHGRQILFSALGELAARKVTRYMSDYYDEHGSILTDDYQYERLTKPGTPPLSPTAQRFIDTMNFWFGNSIREVAREARDEAAPQAPIYESGQSIDNTYVDGRSFWQHQMRVAGREPNMTGTARTGFAGTMANAFTGNACFAAHLIVGQGIRAGLEYPADEIGGYVKRQLGRMARLSSAGRSMTFPLREKDKDLFLNKNSHFYMPNMTKRSGEMLFDGYVGWEDGVISNQEFYNLSESTWAAPEAKYHKSIEEKRWQNPGMCSADIEFKKPEDFEVAPLELLQKLGVTDEIEYNNLTTLFTGVAIRVAEETLFTNWPKVPHP